MGQIAPPAVWHQAGGILWNGMNTAHIEKKLDAEDIQKQLNTIFQEDHFTSGVSLDAGGWDRISIAKV